MKKIILVFGTRPEAIKMCPLVKEFQKYPQDFETIVCVTGQHREMLDQVLRIFEVQPDYDLNIMKQGQDLYDVTARVLVGMRDVLKEVQPDVVLVHGDTTTSTAAALAAFYQQIPVGHVEAGLRTHNIYSPWPEEMNRQITGRISTFNFSPTPLSEKNLMEEKAQGKIFVTGNTVIDALHMVVGKLKSNKALADEQVDVLKAAGYDVTRLTQTIDSKLTPSNASHFSTLNSQLIHYPVVYFKSDTTGEKAYEEFYIPGEKINMERFKALGVIEETTRRPMGEVNAFFNRLESLFEGDFTKEEVVEAIKMFVPNFEHEEKGKNLDQKM